MTSVGSSRVAVNWLAAISRLARPTLVILSITFSGIAVAEAPAQQKSRVAATEAGGTVVGLGAGMGSSWAGCVAGASLALPSLIIPIWGEVTEGVACLVGGIAFGLGFVWAGNKAGRTEGGAIYDFVTTIRY